VRNFSSLIKSTTYAISSGTADSPHPILVSEMLMLTEAEMNADPSKLPITTAVPRPEGNAKSYQNDPTENEAPGCENPPSSSTIPKRTVDYHKSYLETADSSLRERSVLEDQLMPASQPVRQPLVAVLLPGEHRDIRLDVNDLLANADEWMGTPNTNYAGRRPVDLIGTPDEQLLRDTLRSVLYSGMA
jgi:hypothetical protein